MLVSVVWGETYVFAGYQYQNFALYNYFMAAAGGASFISGMLSMAYVSIISTEKKYVELDLLLYLISLNAICFFSTDDVFNNNLHMILDIRTLVLLYSCLYEPKEKVELLNLRNFVLISFLIIVSFVLFANETDTGTTGHITNFLGNSNYLVIGILMMSDARYGYNRFQSIISKRREEIEQEIAQQ
jgi:hypothetical protein